MKLPAIRLRRIARAAYSYDPRRDGVTQSTLQAWLTCRQFAWLKYVKGLRPRGIGKAMVFGNVAHGSLALTTARLGQSKIEDDPHRLAVRCVVDVEAAAESVRLELGPMPATETLDDLELSKAVLSRIMPVYWRRWGPRDAAVEWLKLEQTFRVPVTVCDSTGLTSKLQVVPLVGKYDGVMRTKKGTIKLFETKTKGQILDSLADALPLDLQLATYLYALGKEHPDKDPGVAVYNIIRRPGERRRNDESLADYALRITERAKKEPDHYFTRMEMALTKEEKDRHRRRIQALVQDFYLWWLEAKDFLEGDLRYNSFACETKYGPCEYLPKCSRDDDVPYVQLRTPHPEL